MTWLPSGRCKALTTVLAVVFCAAAQGAGRSRDDRVQRLLDAYHAGRYDAVWAELASSRSFKEVRQGISDRKGVVAPETLAAFAIEASIVALQLPESERTRYGQETGLFEDACKIVRGLPDGGAFEAAWHAVALAVLDADFALGIDRDDHLGHIRGRLDEGMRTLAVARSPERGAWYFLLDVKSALQNDLDDSRVRRGRVNVREALEYFDRARRSQNVGTEAALRHGALLAEWSPGPSALDELLAVASEAAEPRLEYLALVHAGRLLQVLGRSEEARATLERAVAAYQMNRAAHLSLASLHFAANRRNEADRHVRQALEFDDWAADPWFDYFDGAWPELDVRLAAMREAVR
jgi:tetratricopeptide (TPR) repeat protein